MKGDDLLYKIWVNVICSHSPKTIDKFMHLNITPDELPLKNDKVGIYRKVLGDEIYKSLQEFDLSEAKQILEYCTQNNIRIISIDDDDYPKMLKNVDLPPQLLYAKGEKINLNDYLPITIVGSRRATSDGRQFAHKLAYTMADKGVITVSGMALGIDVAAHMGAINAGQKTVAVLAGGVDVVYPKENTDVYNKILENGMIISERPPLAVGRSSYYKERNRIIVGISYGVVIVEGTNHAGTTITAGYAGDYGRNLFAVPGSPLNALSELPNGLIKDGATVVTCADDVLSEYRGIYDDLLDNGISILKEEPDEENIIGIDINLSDEIDEEAESGRGFLRRLLNKNKNKDKNNKENKEPDLSGFNEQERIILKYLISCGGEVHIDEIINETKLPVSTVSMTLVTLQMKGAVSQQMGSLYKAKM